MAGFCLHSGCHRPREQVPSARDKAGRVLLVQRPGGGTTCGLGKLRPPSSPKELCPSLRWGVHCKPCIGFGPNRWPPSRQSALWLTLLPGLQLYALALGAHPSPCRPAKAEAAGKWARTAATHSCAQPECAGGGRGRSSGRFPAPSTLCMLPSMGLNKRVSPSPALCTPARPGLRCFSRANLAKRVTRPTLVLKTPASWEPLQLTGKVGSPASRCKPAHPRWPGTQAAGSQVGLSEASSPQSPSDSPHLLTATPSCSAHQWRPREH